MTDLTETRSYWLSVVRAHPGRWVRHNTETRHVVTNRKMPEPVYQWLMAEDLIRDEPDGIYAKESDA